MKKVYASLILLIATIALCTTENIFIAKSTEKAKQQTIQIQKDVQKNNLKNALENAKKLKSNWENDMKILGMICDHRNIDEIEELIDIMEMSLEKPDFDETFWSESTKILIELENLKENQEISLVNIL